MRLTSLFCLCLDSNLRAPSFSYRDNLILIKLCLLLRSMVPADKITFKIAFMLWCVSLLPISFVYRTPCCSCLLN
jgi:hypothetical protein